MKKIFIFLFSIVLLASCGKDYVEPQAPAKINTTNLKADINKGGNYKSADTSLLITYEVSCSNCYIGYKINRSEEGNYEKGGFFTNNHTLAKYDNNKVNWKYDWSYSTKNEDMNSAELYISLMDIDSITNNLKERIEIDTVYATMKITLSIGDSIVATKEAIYPDNNFARNPNTSVLEGLLSINIPEY